MAISSAGGAGNDTLDDGDGDDNKNYNLSSYSTWARDRTDANALTGMTVTLSDRR